MPIAIVDATTAEHADGGIGIVIRGLLEGIQSLRLGDDVVVLRGGGLQVPHGIRSLKVPIVATRYGRLAYQRLLIAADPRLAKLEAARLIAMDSYVPLLPVPGVTERACFVHDVLPITHPEYFSRARLVPKRIGLASTRRASAVFTSSECTAARVKRHLGVDAQPVRFGCGQLSDAEADALLASPRAERGNYFVYVGAIEERKDLRTLVSAITRVAPDAAKGPILAIVGNHRTPEGRRIREWAKTVAGDRVRFLGRLDNSQMRDLVLGARAVVYPSLAEGFGLPVLEGMALGTPVIASDIPEIRSWAGDACLYFPPRAVDVLAEALREVSGEVGEVGVTRGRALSERYRWRSFAADLLA